MIFIIHQKRGAHSIFSAFKFACMCDLFGPGKARALLFIADVKVRIHTMYAYHFRCVNSCYGHNTFATAFWSHYNGYAAESLLLPWEMDRVLWLYATVANESL